MAHLSLLAPAGMHWQYAAHAYRLLTLDPQPTCLAVLLGARLRWRACIRLPAPLVLTTRFCNVQDAAHSLEWISRDTTMPEQLCNAAHPAIDSHWQDEHDRGSSRIAGGVTVTVRPVTRSRRERWQVWLGADLVSRLHSSLGDAQQWLDALLPPPPSREVEDALRSLKQAVRIAVARFPSDADGARRGRDYTVRSHAAWSVLARQGMDEGSEARIVDAWVQGGRVCFTLPGHAGVIV